MSRGQVVVWTVVVGVLLAGSVAAAVDVVPSTGGSAQPAAAGAGAAATQIDSCTEITEPGRYVLTTDIEDDKSSRLSDACIRIVADDVIFDGGNHTVDGKGISDTRGVVANASNVTVRNVAVSDWNRGVYYRNASDGTIRGVTATGNAFGIDLDWSRDVVVADSAALDNLIGIDLVRSNDGLELEGNDAAGNHVADVNRNGST